MLRSERAFNLAVSVVTAIVLSGASAWAIAGGAGRSHHAAATSSSTSAPCKPGFGHGDKNHCHSGPPGSTTSTSSTSTSSSTSSSTTTSSTTTSTTTTTAPSTTSTSVPCKPGWGYGDKNHCHSGPPGHSESHKSGKNK